jgi:antitoxin MazE
MRSRVIKIGSSQGLRIPKPILEQTGISDVVEIEVQKNQLIIRPVKNPREGWDDAFKALGDGGDDESITPDENLTHSWDEEEWEWSRSVSTFTWSTSIRRSAPKFRRQGPA